MNSASPFSKSGAAELTEEQKARTADFYPWSFHRVLEARADAWTLKEEINVDERQLAFLEVL